MILSIMLFVNNIFLNKISRINLDFYGFGWCWGIYTISYIILIKGYKIIQVSTKLANNTMSHFNPILYAELYFRIWLIQITHTWLIWHFTLPLFSFQLLSVLPTIFYSKGHNSTCIKFLNSYWILSLFFEIIRDPNLFQEVYNLIINKNYV